LPLGLSYKRGVQRRTLLQAPAAGLASRVAVARPEVTPRYRVVTAYRPLARPGMPGPWPGRVVRLRAPRAIDDKTDRVDRSVVRQMLGRGICALTGEPDPPRAWARLIAPDDVVGIKVNCSGHPHVVSSPELVAEVVDNLLARGVTADRICLYERFINQLREVNYTPHLPTGVRQLASNQLGSTSGHYDPFTYVEVDFFGEEDTRSNLIRPVAETFTKIINIANIKDHGASGATGCLKNIAYGSFSNVARSHEFTNGRSHTLSFIGTLAAVEPLRSRTVLQLVDGLRGVWHGGPFARNMRYVFYPKQIWLGTDPVALDTLVLDVVDEERRRRGAPSIYDRDPGRLGSRDQRDGDPRVEVLIREPGHVAFAARLGLGLADKRRIRITDLEI
jgi:uncharacterized protein (DUF362 family)